MKLPVQIQFHGMSRFDALAVAARDHVHKLGLFVSHIMTCRVVIDEEQKHTHQGRWFSVRINLTLPGHKLVVNRVQYEAVNVGCL
jgi:hypothetical protein